jgi:hypothetical protein
VSVGIKSEKAGSARVCCARITGKPRYIFLLCDLRSREQTISLSSMLHKCSVSCVPFSFLPSSSCSNAFLTLVFRLSSAKEGCELTCLLAELARNTKDTFSALPSCLPHSCAHTHLGGRGSTPTCAGTRSTSCAHAQRQRSRSSSSHPKGQAHLDRLQDTHSPPGLVRNLRMSMLYYLSII